MLFIFKENTILVEEFRKKINEKYIVKQKELNDLKYILNG